MRHLFPAPCLSCFLSRSRGPLYTRTHTHILILSSLSLSVCIADAERSKEYVLCCSILNANTPLLQHILDCLQIEDTSQAGKFSLEKDGMMLARRPKQTPSEAELGASASTVNVEDAFIDRRRTRSRSAQDVAAEAEEGEHSMAPSSTPIAATGGQRVFTNLDQLLAAPYSKIPLLQSVLRLSRAPLDALRETSNFKDARYLLAKDVLGEGNPEPRGCLRIGTSAVGSFVGS